MQRPIPTGDEESVVACQRSFYGRLRGVVRADCHHNIHGTSVTLRKSRRSVR